MSFGFGSELTVETLEPDLRKEIAGVQVVEATHRSGRQPVIDEDATEPVDLGLFDDREDDPLENGIIREHGLNEVRHGELAFDHWFLALTGAEVASHCSALFAGW